MSRDALEGAARAPGRDDPAVRVITPPRGGPRIDLAELWSYRELLLFLAWRDVKVRYKQTFLGASWAVLQPLLAMAIFTLFFGRLAGLGKTTGGVPYTLFVFAGLLPWTLFANTVTQAGESLVASRNLVTKIYFPRLIIPLSSIGAYLVDFAIASAVLVAMMAAYRVAPDAWLALLPLVVGLVALTALAVGTLFAALSAHYRDFRYVLPFLVQIWLFVTPVIYPLHLVPARYRWILAINPMAGLIEAFRRALLGPSVDWQPAHLAIGATAAVVAFVLAATYFQRLDRSLADIA